MLREGVVRVEPCTTRSTGTRTTPSTEGLTTGLALVWHKLVAWNVAGLKLVTNDLFDIVKREKPSAIVLTEVKIAATTLKRLGSCLGYSGYATAPPMSESKGGVILLASPAL